MAYLKDPKDPSKRNVSRKTSDRDGKADIEAARADEAVQVDRAVRATDDAYTDHLADVKEAEGAHDAQVRDNADAYDAAAERASLTPTEHPSPAEPTLPMGGPV